MHHPTIIYGVGMLQNATCCYRLLHFATAFLSAVFAGKNGLLMHDSSGQLAVHCRLYLNCMKKLIPIALAMLPLHSSFAQTYTIDASQVNTSVRTGHLKMGNAGPAGKELVANSRYLTLGGKPVIPVMGEVHFTRIPRHRWEETILKMKAGGVNIIATYVFWIHHEEVEGQFEWTGNRDFRAFVELCARHGLWVYPRIGPWCHGEVRNGATPDWVLLKKNIQDRSNDPVYQFYAGRLYSQVAAQMKGLLYKDGGPIIGVQLENEYRRGKGGEAHILWLKQTALKCGIDVPMYTVTGWGNASVPAYEVLPLYGAYPDEPWATNLQRSTGCENFRFTPFRDDEKIGNGAGNKKDGVADNNAYPFFTCETGVGIENTNHRRLEIGTVDGAALITQKIGSGSNLPGYYMFTGGSNPVGLFSTLQEDKEETGYYNDNPVISYDFQAAIRESGDLNGSYYQVKKLHYFLHEFGDVLAPMEPVFPAVPSGLSYVARASEKAAFVFGINYCRNNVQPAVDGVQFTVQLAHETVRFPSQPVRVADSSVFIWPVNFNMGSLLLKYATAQPLCHIQDNWVFVQDAAAAPEFCLDGMNVERVVAANGRVAQKDGRYLITGLTPGTGCVVTVYPKGGSAQKLIVLSKAQALQSWLLGEEERKQLLVTDANVYLNKDSLCVYSTREAITLQVVSGTGELAAPFEKAGTNGVFEKYRYRFAAQQIPVTVTRNKVLDNAIWLKSSSIVATDRKNELFHRFFMKEFSLNNTAGIKSAILYIGMEQGCKVQVNNRWVNQPLVAGQLNTLDVTGYVAKGENALMLAFPFTAGIKSFAAKLEITFNNAQQVVLYSDSSWLVKDHYNYPSFLVKSAGFKLPEVTSAVEALNTTAKGAAVYTIGTGKYDAAGLSNVYLKVAYSGDKAALRYRHNLVGDDFNNGTVWTTGLFNYTWPMSEQSLQLQVTPLESDAGVFFDRPGVKEAALKAAVQKVELVPEYVLKVKS